MHQITAALTFCAAMRSSELGVLSTHNVDLFNWIMWARRPDTPRTITIEVSECATT